MQVRYPRCAGLDVHQQTVVACARVASGSTVQQDVRTIALGDARRRVLHGPSIEVKGGILLSEQMPRRVYGV